MQRISLIPVLLFTVTIVAQTSKVNLALQKEEKREYKAFEEIFNAFFQQKNQEKTYKKARYYLKEGKTDMLKSYATSVLSSYFLYENHSDSAMYYAEKTLAYKNFSTDSIKRMRNVMATMNLASAYLNKGLRDKAKEKYIEGIENAERWEDKNNYYGFLINLGNLYYLDNEYDKALELFKKGQKSREPRVKVICAASIGSIYGDLKDFKKSNEYYYQSLAIDKNDVYNNLTTRLNIASNLFAMGNTPKAITTFKEIIKEGEEKKYDFHVEAGKRKLAEIYVKEKNYKVAEQLLLPILEQDKKRGNLQDMLKDYEDLKNATKGQNKFEKALEYSEQFITINDSIKGLQKTKEINELEVKFETAQKEKEIVLLKKNEELKDQKIAQQATVRNIILIGSILIIIAILFLLRFYFQKLKTQKKLNKTQEAFNYQKIKSLMKKQELELVKASIEGQDTERKRLARGLHDSIGSNMAAIQLQFEELPEGSTRLQKIKNDLSETYEQIRELSHNLLPKKIRQNDYSVVLNEYIKNIDEIADVKINLSVTEKDIINQADKHLQSEIFAILQELISNTLKHAKASVIDIQLEVIEDVIYLSYEDDGVGFDTKKIHNGIGLKNMKDRVSQLSGNCIIDSHPQRGTLFRMEVDKDIYVMKEVV
ncbi:tetratricopeptide repeat-containing sensor histidine kinase [Tenacibaculum agarivorans]|uniref:tetratricopeptide repeat-containing sensor histidine kinase n=1 Tax=Tenacibaculum agarivorans TaxID=1908389 RepID=UPI00094B9ACB|nr:sensor histidine kinase [Tenacibaculum agarivorans]